MPPVDEQPPGQRPRRPPLRRVNEPTQKECYAGYLRQMMGYLNNRVYQRGYQFSIEELGQLTPEDVYRWMAVKAYGIEDPGPDDNPTDGRSSSLEYYKKAISYFMPNRLIPWNELLQVGNPTRSVIVNDLITAVRRKEVRKQGKPSQADRPFERQEFDLTVEILGRFPDHPRKYMYPCIFKFQFHLIARLDDSCHLKKENIKLCRDFDFTLTAKLRWSKNVHEE